MTDTAAEATAPSLSSHQIWDAVSLATERYNFYEEVVQTRLQSFLFADSILLLAWVTLYSVASSDHHYWRLILISFSTLSVFLCASWTILEFRHKKFFLMQMDIVLTLEQALPDALRINQAVSSLQYGKPYLTKYVDQAEKQVYLNKLEVLCDPRRLSIATPVCFGLVSLVLLWTSIFA